MLLRSVITIVAVALLAVACGGTDADPVPPPAPTTIAPAPAAAPTVPPPAPTTTAAAPAKRRPTLKVVDSRFGRTIADRHGEALYLFEADPANRSVCDGACAAAWPPLLATRKPTVSGALDPALVGTTRRNDGTRQVTYDGHPLYYYVGDEPGVIRCQYVDEYGGLWLIVRTDGTANRSR